jgi:O-antigen/teichoic acid export membrane protein
MAFNVLIVSILNVLLCIILIPRYGMNGAAFSTMLSFIVLSLLFLVQGWHYFSIVPLKKEMFKVLMAACISAVIVFIIKNSLQNFIISNFSTLFSIHADIFTNILIILAGAIIFIVLYVALIISTKCLDENDILIWKGIKRKIF